MSSPPITPARPIAPRSSQTTVSSTDSVRATPSSVVSFSPSLGGAHDDVALELGEVVAVDRVTELEHHVVGDVDSERDRPHTGLLDALRHPARSRTRRVESLDDACGEHRAAFGVLDLDRVALTLGRHLDVCRIGEVETVCQRRVASDSAQRQRVGAIGVDLEVEHLCAEAEQLDRVVADLSGAGLDDDDAAGVTGEAELGARADHAVGHVAVGLACSDREATGQHRAGQRHDDQVALDEVVGTADDAATAIGVVVRRGRRRRGTS